MRINLFAAYKAKLRCVSNTVTRMPHIDAEIIKKDRHQSLPGLLYRYFFYQWLFLDMAGTRGPIERRAAWLHNQSQREWLPAYMRRWATLSTVGFALGAISEQALAAPVFAACWYTGSCICVSVLAIIAEVWLLLGRKQSV